MTVTGRTIGEEADAARGDAEGQEVVRPLDEPLKPTGGLAILRGNLAPEGCVVKLAGHERMRAPRPGARLRVARRTRSRPSRASEIKPGDVVVIRNEGPAGGPGMREMLARDGGAGRARDSATRSRCSPTAASPARPTASWPATSRPRRPTAGRSPPSGTATPSIFDVADPRAERRADGRRDRRAGRRLRAAAAALHDGRARQVRPPRRLGRRGRAHALTAGAASASAGRRRRNRRAAPGRTPTGSG